METTTNPTAHDAQNWAWSEVTNPNMNWDIETTPLALVFLAYARLADVALCSGQGYGNTSADDVAALLGLGYRDVLFASATIAASGLLETIGHGFYRLPERAFQ